MTIIKMLNGLLDHKRNFGFWQFFWVHMCGTDPSCPTSPERSANEIYGLHSLHPTNGGSFLPGIFFLLLNLLLA